MTFKTTSIRFSRRNVLCAVGPAFALAVAAVLTPVGARAVADASVESASLPPDVGSVTRARVSVKAVTAADTRHLDDGSAVRFRDTIVTGAATRAEIVLVDDGKLYLGDHTELLIDELIYDAAANKAVVVNLTKGVFRMVTGKFNKVPGGKITMVTPVATVGVRGTDFWGLQEADKLTMVLIDNGRLDISNGRDSVTLDTPLTGVIITAGAAEIQRITLTPEELREAARTITY